MIDNLDFLEKKLFKINLGLVNGLLLKIFITNKPVNLVLPGNFKYNWLMYNYNFLKLYKIKNNHFVYSSFLLKNKTKISKKHESVLNVIRTKKHNGLIKSDFNIYKNMLNKFFYTKKPFNFNFFKKNYFIKNEHNKSYDLKKNMKKILNKNKDYLSYILKKKYHNTNVYIRHIRNFVKFNNNKIALMVELSIKNILMRSGFFYNYRDIGLFFLERNIYVNGVVCTNSEYVLRLGDVVSVEFDENNFLFFRKNLEHKNYILNKISNIHTKMKNPNNHINRKIQNYTNICEDTPNYLEVDFLTMSIILIKYPTNFKNFNNILTTYMNLYLKRSYMWKFIT